MPKTSQLGATIGGERFTPVRFPSLPEAVAEKLREALGALGYTQTAQS